MVFSAIVELAIYAEQHGLKAVHHALTRAIETLRASAGKGSQDFETDDLDWFGHTLELLIAYARKQGFIEVVDHLLEAKMAWDERDSGEPDGNIIEFRQRKRD